MNSSTSKYRSFEQEWNRELKALNEASMIDSSSKTTKIWESLNLNQQADIYRAMEGFCESDPIITNLELAILEVILLVGNCSQWVK